MELAQLEATRYSISNRLERPQDYGGRRSKLGWKLLSEHKASWYQTAVISLGLLRHHAKATGLCMQIGEDVDEHHQWGLSQKQKFVIGTYILSSFIDAGLCRLDFSNHKEYKCVVVLVEDGVPLGRVETYTQNSPFKAWTAPVDEQDNKLVDAEWVPEDWHFSGRPPSSGEQRLWHPDVDRSMRSGDYGRRTILTLDANPVYKSTNSGPLEWVKAVNHVEKNAYRINKEMLSLVKKLDDILPQGLVGKVFDPEPAIKKLKRAVSALNKKYEADKLDADSIYLRFYPQRSQEIEEEYQKEHSKLKAKIRELRRKRSMRVIFIAFVDKATELSKEERFYQRVFLEHRGRMFLSRSLLNFTGGDLPRSLVEFSDGLELKRQGRSRWKDGYEYLLLHATNLYEEKGSFEYRVQFGRKHLEEWIGYAKDAVGTYPAWTVDDNDEELDDPLQFIRACMELRDATSPTRLIPRKGFVSHLPVELDQTNSVIQHIAAIRLDIELAKQSNMIASSDFYDSLAEVIPIDESLTKKQRRKIMKKIVVPKCYGAGSKRIASQLKELDIPYLQKLDDETLIGIADVAKKDLEEKVPAIKEFGDDVQDIREKVTDISANGMSWSLPSGFEVHLKPLLTKPQEVELPRSKDGGRVKLKAQHRTGLISQGKIIKAVQAAVIHSFDAAVAHRICAEAAYKEEHSQDNEVFPIISIHDSWAVHAYHADELRDMFLDAFTLIHQAELPYHVFQRDVIGKPLPALEDVLEVPEDDEVRGHPKNFQFFLAMQEYRDSIG